MGPLIADLYSPLEVAAYELVHKHPLKAAGLAARSGMRPGTLNNKVDPNYEGSSLFVQEAVALQLAADDFRIHIAEGILLNRASIPLLPLANVGDVELLNAYAKYHAEVGETAKALMDALEDKRITRAEFETIRREAFEDIAALLELLKRVEAVVDE